MTPESVLHTAEQLIYGDRETTYGDPGKNLRAIAALWGTYLTSRGFMQLVDRAELSAEDVSMMMVLLKVARLANTPGHRDSLVDICGYAALVERVQHADTCQQKGTASTA